MESLRNWSNIWLDRPKQNYIGGRFVTGQGREWQNTNPATEEPSLCWRLPSQAQVDEAVDGARQCFEQGAWNHRPMRERAETLRKIAAVIRANEAQLATLETLATGKTFQEASQDDLPDCSSIFELCWMDR